MVLAGRSFSHLSGCEPIVYCSPLNEVAVARYTLSVA